MKHTSSLLRVTGSALIALALLAPLGPSQAAPGGAAARVVLASEPRSLDPTIDTIKTSLVITHTILEALVLNKPDGGFQPHLAESWQAVDPLRWRVKLRRGVQFHNGEPFNADAVAYTVDAFLKTRGEARGWFSFVSGTQKVDPFTIDFVLSEANSNFPATLAFLYVFPPRYHAQAAAEFGTRPVGTGPYRFVEWTRGNQMRVAANPTYWGAKRPAIGEIQFRWAPDASARTALAATGEVDIAQNIPPAQIERIERSGVARIETARSLRRAFIRMNLGNGPTTDVRVRRAMNHAVDVDTIIRVLFRGRAYGRVAGFIYPGFEGYQGDKLQPYKYDPDLAKRLLAEAGYPNGFEITFWHTIGRYALDKESVEAIQGQLERVGVRARLQGMEAGAYFSRISSERVPGMNFAASAPLFMTPMYHPLIEFRNKLPYAYGANDVTTQFVKEAIAETNPAKRLRRLQNLERYIFEKHVPWIWLWDYQDIYAASNRINWKARSDEFLSFEDVSFR
ncbi:MAG: hypothetical protein FJX78_00695 [Armatimonadetes bacterium]|nr:hypothetical protein [Armatimonadota bacterium]